MRIAILTSIVVLFLICGCKEQQPPAQSTNQKVEKVDKLEMRCKSRQGCPEGNFVCRGGICVELCKKTADCPKTMHCHQKQCKYLWDINCQKGDDCPENTFCVEKMCEKSRPQR